MEARDPTEKTDECCKPGSEIGHFTVTKIKNLIDLAQVQSMGAEEFISKLEIILEEPDHGQENCNQLCLEKHSENCILDDISSSPNENERVDASGSNVELHMDISTQIQNSQAASQQCSATTEQVIELINSIIDPAKLTQIQERDVMELENVMGNLYQYSEVLERLPRMFPFSNVVSAHVEAREKLKDLISEKRELVLEGTQKKFGSSRNTPSHLSVKKSFFKISANGESHILNPIDNFENLPKNSLPEISILEIQNQIKSDGPYLDTNFLSNERNTHEEIQSQQSSQEIDILKSKIKELEQKLKISEGKLRKIENLLIFSNSTESIEINSNLTKDENLGFTLPLITVGASDETQSLEQTLDLVNENGENSPDSTSDWIFEIVQETEMPIPDSNKDSANSSADAQMLLRGTSITLDSSTSILDFTYEEKLDISRQLQLLPAPKIQSFIELLCSEEPDLTWSENGDLNVDLQVLKLSTLVAIKSFLSEKQIYDLKQIRTCKAKQNSKQQQLSRLEKVSEKVTKNETQTAETSRNLKTKRLARSRKVAPKTQSKSKKYQRAIIARKSMDRNLSKPQRNSKGKGSISTPKSMIKSRSKVLSSTESFSRYKPGSIKWKLLRNLPVKDADGTYKCFWPIDCRYKKIGMRGPSKIKKHYRKHVNDEKTEEKTGQIYSCLVCERQYRHHKSFLHHICESHSKTHDL